MKPINSKEKSKQLWQFVFIFFALAFVPVALIFYSYYKVPDKISETEQARLISYSNFEHSQKVIIQKMMDVDSNINLYASGTNQNPEILSKKIVDGLADLSKMDTSNRIIRLVSDGFTGHYTHVKELVTVQEKYKKAALDLQELQDKLKSSENDKNLLMMSRGAAPAQQP